MEADHVKVYKTINRLEMPGPCVRLPGENFNTKVVLFPVVHYYSTRCHEPNTDGFKNRLSKSTSFKAA